MIHGDFAEWNVHYTAGGDLAGVIDFGLSHVDSRPYDLAIARTYRSPETLDAYRDEVRSMDWPLTPLEEAAIPLIHHAFRVDMVAWELYAGRRTGTYDLEMIRRQLQRTGTPTP
jgi:homoserine kinase type II